MTRHILLTLIACSIWLAAGACQAQAPIRDERQVKATYLYHFSQYGTWPDNAVQDAQGKFIIGLLGPDPFGGFFDALKGKTVGDGKIKIEIRRFGTSDDYKPCHLVFISPLLADNSERTAEQRLAGLLKKRNQHVMIVSDTPGLAKAGAMINSFIGADRAVHLEVNRTEMQKQGLDISPKVLQLPIVHLVR